MLVEHASDGVAVGEPSLSIRGRGYKPSGDRVPAVYCHASGGTYTEPTNTNSTPLMEAITKAGYIVGSCNMGGVTNWGNDTAKTLYGGTVSWLRSAWGAKATGGSAGIGVSMGAIDCLNRAHDDQTQFEALVLMYPATSLEEAHAGAEAAVDAAYGSHANYVTALGTHNPIAYPGDFTIPLLMFLSESDAILDPAIQQDFYDGYGGPKTLVDVTPAAHADLTVIDTDLVTEFLLQYA